MPVTSLRDCGTWAGGRTNVVRMTLTGTFGLLSVVAVRRCIRMQAELEYCESYTSRKSTVRHALVPKHWQLE